MVCEAARKQNNKPKSGQLTKGPMKAIFPFMLQMILISSFWFFQRRNILQHQTDSSLLLPLIFLTYAIVGGIATLAYFRKYDAPEGSDVTPRGGTFLTFLALIVAMLGMVAHSMDTTWRHEDSEMMKACLRTATLGALIALVFHKNKYLNLWVLIPVGFQFIPLAYYVNNPNSQVINPHSFTTISVLLLVAGSLVRLCQIYTMRKDNYVWKLGEESKESYDKEWFSLVLMETMSLAATLLYFPWWLAAFGNR